MQIEIKIVRVLSISNPLSILLIASSLAESIRVELLLNVYIGEAGLSSEKEITMEA